MDLCTTSGDLRLYSVHHGERSVHHGFTPGDRCTRSEDLRLRSVHHRRRAIDQLVVRKTPGQARCTIKSSVNLHASLQDLQMYARCTLRGRSVH